MSDNVLRKVVFSRLFLKAQQELEIFRSEKARCNTAGDDVEILR
jgi:hypothetical protein